MLGTHSILSKLVWQLAPWYLKKKTLFPGIRLKKLRHYEKKGSVVVMYWPELLLVESIFTGSFTLRHCPNGLFIGAA